MNRGCRRLSPGAIELCHRTGTKDIVSRMQTILTTEGMVDIHLNYAISIVESFFLQVPEFLNDLM